MSTILIVGGSGYVGQHLTTKYLSMGWKVVSFDRCVPPRVCPNAKYEIGDVLNFIQLSSVMSEFKPSVVIHLASFGMSGSDMLSPKCFDININGVINTVDACIHAKVSLLIYTSTYNVVFGGQEILNGNEYKPPHFPTHLHTDCYGPSKTMAEKVIMQSNGRSHDFTGKSNNTKSSLRTCIVRPAAIYGEDECRHFPRIVKHMDCGIFQFRISNKGMFSSEPVLVDWVYIDNLVFAYTCIVKKFGSSSDNGNQKQSTPSVPNQHKAKEEHICPEDDYSLVYYISDGSPIDSFEFLRPLCEARHTSFPCLVLPLWFMLIVASISENLFFLTKKYLSFLCPNGVEPFLTQAEVYKVGVSHFFSIDKAKKEIGYYPVIANTQEGAARMKARYDITRCDNSAINTHFFQPAALGIWLLILSGMGLLMLFAFEEPTSPLISRGGVLDYIRSFALGIFQTHYNLKVVFVLAALTHAVEAAVAGYVALGIGCTQTYWFWILQTMCLGGPSLAILYERKRLCLSLRR